MTKSKTKDMTKFKSKGDFRLGSGVRTRLKVLIWVTAGLEARIK